MVGTNMCFFTAVVSTQTPKRGQWVSIPQQPNWAKQTTARQIPENKSSHFSGDPILET